MKERKREREKEKERDRETAASHTELFAGEKERKRKRNGRTLFFALSFISCPVVQSLKLDNGKVRFSSPLSQERKSDTQVFCLALATQSFFATLS